MKKISYMLILAMCVGAIPSAYAASISLATAPLATATTSTVLPNLMFVLDNSGSMDWDYLPDIVGNYTSDVTLFNNPKFNGVMYDPSILYSVPAYYTTGGSPDTSTYPSQLGTSLATGANTSVSMPNWQKVKVDAYGIQSTSTTNVQTMAATGKIFGFIPGEICKAVDLKDCIAGIATTATYPYAASVRWCNSKTAATAATVTATSGSNSCRATYISGSYQYARYPTVRTATITISGSSSTSVSGITVNGTEILSAATAATTSSSTQAINIAAAINACNGSVQGACGAAGYGATVSSSTVTIYANSQTTLSTPVITKSGSMTLSASSFASKNNATTGTTSSVPGYNLIRVIPTIGGTALYPDIGSSTKATARTDCAGSTCTANEELINYANWYTYYHTRMQMMKTSASNAFKSIDNKYRVGFNTIDTSSGSYNTGVLLNVGTFESTQKYNWYHALFQSAPSGSTPLRMALSNTGKYFADKLSSQTDPMQYSCQQNFTILSTDGYWNESDSYVTKLNGSAMTDQDGGTTARPKYEGPTASSNSLADVAKYYYDTDLRNSSLSNCTSGTTGEDVCTDNVFVSSTDTNTKQHMTSFTLGLGADGQLVYQSDYLTATSGDYYNIVNGTANWSVPASNTATTIDDLWHAAVNGNGQYFSAKSPSQLSQGLSTALASINSRVGAGAAAATSTLNPVAGDNYAYVASYTTAKWYGNLEERTVNTTTGEVSKDAVWCVENITADTCTSPSTVVTATDGSGQVYCVTSGATSSSCTTGTFDATVGTCSVPMATSCTGTLPPKVAATSDTRTIMMSDGAGGLVNFNYANVTAAGVVFDPTLLSQYSTLTAAQQANATAANLVNYLRGQKGYEIAASNTTDNQVFRYRQAVMGDAVESQPAYIASPVYSYADPGYGAFKITESSRAGTVYVGTNDGMLHAFNASTGNENWAFVPTPVIQNMWKLADNNYANMHTYYVNGDITIGDVCTANCTSSAATWKTILVGGLHAGGRGYYALDITNPVNPSLLWEFTSSDNANLGYSFGAPIITKKSDGTWVVLLTSGYNNSESSVGDGRGRLFILNAATGVVINTISTGVGSTATPSGLAQINDYVDNLASDNTAGYIYGGDLLGNVWRFDINALTVMKFATLLDTSSNPQPITVRPELASVNNTRIVYVGSGKYLEVSDLTNTQLQTVYGISDPNATATLNNARASLVQQTLTQVAGTGNRTVSNNGVDYGTSRGWYIDLPDTGERQNVPSTLASGTLIVPSNVPTSTVCSPGGYGWLNYVDYKTGGTVDAAGSNTALLGSTKTNAMIVGLNVMYIGTSYNPVVNVVTADNPTPTLIDVPFVTSSAGFQKRRVIWRELIN